MNWLKSFQSSPNYATDVKQSPSWSQLSTDLENASASPAYDSSSSTLPGSRQRNFKWTGEEDELLKQLVVAHNFDWDLISQYFQGKTPSQVSKRWINKLDPNIRKAKWTADEDEVIVNMVAQLGHNWKVISKYLDGRPPDAIKSRYYSNLRKKASSKTASSKPTSNSHCIYRYVDESTLSSVNSEETFHESHSAFISSINQSALTELEEAVQHNPSSMSREEKRAFLQRLNKRVVDLQMALSNTSVQIQRLEEEMFPPDYLI